MYLLLTHFLLPRLALFGLIKNGPAIKHSVCLPSLLCLRKYTERNRSINFVGLVH